MTNSLFRQEVLSKPAEAGQSLVLDNAGMRTILLGVSLLLAMLVGLSLFTHYTRRASAPGLLTPPQGTVKVFALRNGTVAELKVAEGTQVVAGQVLAVMRSERSLEQGLLGEIERQQQTVQGSMGRASSRAQAELQRLSERDAALVREIDQLQSLQAVQAQRLQIAEQKREAMQQMLGKGFISANGFRDHEEAVLTQLQQAKELERQRASREADREQLKQELTRARLAAMDEHAQLTSTQSDLKQKSLEMAERQESEIRAPVAGRVAALQAVVGQVANTNQPLLALVPDGVDLEAELLVPSRAIGFIQAGQAVRLQVAAFPYQRYGLQPGVVRTVSETVLAPNELNLPISIQEPVYRVKVALNSQQVTAFGQQHPLRPGMAVSADIVIDRRPVWQWLFEPLIAVKGRMFD
ncbi:HlyD family secretion protein [Chitinimonas sp. PSY-7]|uniref:HlyD family efflux transporter periplasmic adaptor subunit n=1 Tax=Chitinimonas sp. PSY-7 TaxID=3459088 RepID=UPI0040401F32